MKRVKQVQDGVKRKMGNQKTGVKPTCQKKSIGGNEKTGQRGFQKGGAR